MAVYELYGRGLVSDMALPELPIASTPARPGLEFSRRLPAPAEGPWFVIWYRPDGGAWVRACRTRDGYRLQYCNCAEFHLDPVRRAITGDAIDCSEEMFRHFLIDQVVPLMLSVESPVLHASAVGLDDASLVAFSGPGGSGKSTLVMALARLGHAPGSDDGLFLQTDGYQITAVPAYPGVRLWPDSERAVAAGLAGSGRTEPVAKQRFSRGLRFARREGALTQLYVLDAAPAPTIRFERLSPRDTVVEMVRETYRLALDDRHALARELDVLAVIATRLPCWRLSFPRDLDRCCTLAAAVGEHIRAHAPRAAHSSAEQ